MKRGVHMTKLAEIIDFLEKKAPAETAEVWDNVGLLADAGNKETDTVCVALDATAAAIDFSAKRGAKLLVTHHPVIFHPLKRLSPYPPAVAALTKGVSVLSLHTNLDKAAGGVNDTLAALLGLCDVTTLPDGMTRVGRLPTAKTAADFAKDVAAALSASVAFCGDGTVETVAVCGGGAGDGVFSLPTGVDAYVTGEMKHHEFLAAREMGLCARCGGALCDRGAGDLYTGKMAAGSISRTDGGGVCGHRTVYGNRGLKQWLWTDCIFPACAGRSKKRFWACARTKFRSPRAKSFS